MGLVSRKGTRAGEFLVGDGFSTKVHKSNANGEISESISLALNGFTDVDQENFFIENIVNASGLYYAVCVEELEDNFKNTYITKIDLENEELINIKKLVGSNTIQ